MAAVIFNSEAFRNAMNSEGFVLVDFWAQWCPYCRRIAGLYDKIAQEQEGSILVAKVNIDDEPVLAKQEAIEVIPTLVLYKNGKAVGSIVAPESKAAIDAFLKEAREKA